MSEPSLYEFLAREVKRMSSVCTSSSKGNIYPLIIHEVERCIITAVLEQASYNYFLTATILGISRNKLYRKIEQLNISTKESQRFLVNPEEQDEHE